MAQTVPVKAGLPGSDKTAVQDQPGKRQSSGLLPKLAGKPVQPEGVQKRTEIARLDETFGLDDAMGRAYKEAISYLSELIGHKDMKVDVKVDGNEVAGVIVDSETGEIVKEYKGEDLLRLYAQGRQQRGVIVDGSV